MGPDFAVPAEPCGDDGLDLIERMEPFGVEHLPALGSIEVLIVVILPR